MSTATLIWKVWYFWSSSTKLILRVPGINNYYTFVLGATDRKGQRKGKIDCILIPAWLTWGKENIFELDVKEQISGATMSSRIRNFCVREQWGSWGWVTGHQAVPQEPSGVRRVGLERVHARVQVIGRVCDVKGGPRLQLQMQWVMVRFQSSGGKLSWPCKPVPLRQVHSDERDPGSNCSWSLGLGLDRCEFAVYRGVMG